MSLPHIQASPDGHFLMTEDGAPFFWLADTAWELFHRLDEEEAKHYLEVRQAQGFNVIQAALLAELDGLRVHNANGHLPLLGDDPTRPNEYYFRFVDRIVRIAADQGLYLGLLPTWGDKVHGRLWGIGPAIFNESNAYSYGHFLGERYRQESHILWILGGDRPAEGYQPVWNAMARGLADGLERTPFLTYHPKGGTSSSETLHQATWLTMNMLQSGHSRVDALNWKMIQEDYGRSPTKPVLDGEPNYEDHPIDPYLRKWKPEYGRFTDYEVRKAAYRAVFAGACGHTYGHHSIWQMYTRGREPVTFARTPWEEAIYAPGAAQLVHLKNLVLSRPFFSRVPAPEMLPQAILPSSAAVYEDVYNPHRAAHPIATRCTQGTFGMVYFPLPGQTLQVDLGLFHTSLLAAWFDPRNGQEHRIGEFPPALTEFTSPIGGPDWVLVVDAQGTSSPLIQPH